MKRSKKRISNLFAVLLTVCMVVGLLPDCALQAEAENTTVTLQYKAAGFQDGDLQRYVIEFTVDGIDSLEDKYWTNNHTIYLDGEIVEGLNYLGSGSTLRLYLPYSKVEEDISLAADMGVHSVIIPAGTVIGDLTTSNDVCVKLAGNTGTELTPVSLSYISSHSGIQGNFSRWLVSYEVSGATVESNGVGTLSALTDGEKTTHSTIQRSETVFSALVNFSSTETCTEASSYLSEGGAHRFEVKKGTILNTTWCVIHDVEPIILNRVSPGVTTVTNHLALTFTSGSPQDGTGLQRYWLWFDIESMPESFTGSPIYIDGKQLDKVSYYYADGTSSTSVAILLPYSVVEDGKETASTIGQHVIRIPAGTALANSTVTTEEIILLIDGASVTQVSDYPDTPQITYVTPMYDWRNCGENTSAYFMADTEDPLSYSSDWSKRYTFSEGGIYLNDKLQEDAYLVKITNSLYSVQGITASAGDILMVDGMVIVGNYQVDFAEFSMVRNPDLSYSQCDKEASEIPETTMNLQTVYVDVEERSYEIAHTPLVKNANVDVYVNDSEVSDYTLHTVGEYAIKTVYENVYFAQVVSQVGDLIYNQNVILYKSGDANGDGTRALNDIIGAKKRIAEATETAGYKGADLDCNGTVTAEDMVLLRESLIEKTDIDTIKDTYDTEVGFGVISDMHYASDASDGQRRLNTRKALNYYKSQAVDMIIFNGDIADLGLVTEYEELAEDILSVFPEKETRPKLIFTADNHEYWEAWSHNKTATATYEELQARFKTELESVNDNSDGMNSHYVIDGYHFISISADGMNESTQASYSETTLEFLKNALAEAKSEDATKPIFVNVHQAPANTVIGSDKAGGCSPYLNSILEQYSQAIVFTSHTHASIAEEDSLWQGTYAVMNTGSLYYESGKGNTNYPIEEADQFAQGLMVRVKAGVVDVERCDFYHNTTAGGTWTIGK